MDDVLVLMKGIEKAFPGVHALKDCQFELRSGEIHALVGENGAGKSTLMKVLTGVYARDAGRIFYKGQEVEIPSPKAAQDLGIAIIHQELHLMPHLTVAQNIFIGREPRRGGRFLLDEKQINQTAQEFLDLMNLDLNPKARVADLTVAKQQMVEIVRALSYNSEVLIMDEPTSVLTGTEIDELFRIIRELRDRGVGIVHISHRMEELKQISDRITVMRDGRYIDTVATPEVSIDKIIRMMVGQEIYETARSAPSNTQSKIMLEVNNLNRGNAIVDVSFGLRRGEILGFAGLSGRIP
jgi:ribose transport system ATP-binding protein